MNPLDWLQDNLFYTDAKTKEINDAAYKNAPVQKPQRTQAQKTQEINAGVRSAFGLDKKPSTVVGPGGGNGFGLGSKNTVNTPKSEKVVSPTNNGPNDAASINASLKEEAAARKAALANTAGNYDHSSGGFEGQVWKVPNSLNGGGGGGNRNNERTNPNGVVQKGTDMGRSFNDMLMEVNKVEFSGTQLPTTNGNPFEGRAPKTQSFEAPAPGISGESYDNYGASGGAAAASSTDRSKFTPMSGTEGRIEGGSDRSAGISMADALADKEGINSYMSKFSSGDRERAARRAFLDGDNSMSGLKAMNAIQGKVYAGGQHYISGGDKDTPAVAIKRQESRDISSGKSTAAGLLESYKSRITEAGATTPAESQDPLTAGASAVKSGIEAGAKTDFELNNNQGAPQAGVGPTVPLNEIPKDLSGAAGKEYLRKLDSGALFN